MQIIIDCNLAINLLSTCVKAGELDQVQQLSEALAVYATNTSAQTEPEPVIATIVLPEPISAKKPVAKRGRKKKTLVVVNDDTSPVDSLEKAKEKKREYMRKHRAKNKS